MAASVRRGHGEAVLLLHGIPGSRQTWRAVRAEFGSACHTIAPDLLGFGESSDPPDDFHAGGQADALCCLLERLGCASVHIVGFDFGGPVALTICARSPERVRTLTLVSTNAFTDTPIPGPLKLARVPLLGEALFFAMCSWPGLAGMWLGAVGKRETLTFSRFVDELPHRRGRRWTRRIFLDSLRHLRARYEPVQRALSAVTCPGVVVWGDRDPFFPVSVGERTANSIHGASFEILRGCGHFVPGEAPAELAAIIRRQMAAVSRT